MSAIDLVPKSNFRTPNPDIRFRGRPFRVNTSWRVGPRHGPRRCRGEQFRCRRHQAHPSWRAAAASPGPARGAESCAVAHSRACTHRARSGAHSKVIPSGRLRGRPHVGWARQHAHGRAVCAPTFETCSVLAILDPTVRTRGATRHGTILLCSFPPVRRCGACSTELYQEVAPSDSGGRVCSALPGHPSPGAGSASHRRCGDDLAAFTTVRDGRLSELGFAQRLVGAARRVVAGCLGRVRSGGRSCRRCRPRCRGLELTAPDCDQRGTGGDGCNGRVGDPATGVDGRGRGDEQTSDLPGAGLLGRFRLRK